MEYINVISFHEHIDFQVDPSRYFWRCVSDYCSTHDYKNTFETDDDLEAELTSILCSHLSSYSESCAYYGVRIEWRSNVLCRKYFLANCAVIHPLKHHKMILAYTVVTKGWPPPLYPNITTTSSLNFKVFLVRILPHNTMIERYWLWQSFSITVIRFCHSWL